jgi:hypothetical protein
MFGIAFIFKYFYAWLALPGAGSAELPKFLVE